MAYRTAHAAVSCALIALGIVFASCVTTQQDGHAWASRGRTELHVSPAGNDGATGTAQAPFATLERARDAVRELKRRSGLPDGGVTVWIHGGDHLRRQSFVLSEEDSGTAAAPIVYRGLDGEKPRIFGGQSIDGFTPLKDPAVAARFDADARPHILQADLRAQGVTDFGRIVSRGAYRDAQVAHIELFVNDRPMTLARWPNEGEYVRIAGLIDTHVDWFQSTVGNLESGFRYDTERPERWKNCDDVWMFGYWAYDWTASYEKIASIDTHARIIKTAPPYGIFHFGLGQRFCFLNVMEELDQPGEYYVDAAAGILYFWPPERIEDAFVTVAGEPLIALKGASHITLRGLTIEGTRASAVVVDGGSDVTVGGCTIRNVGNAAAVVSGKRHTITGCDLYGEGDGGIAVSGGDRATLEPAGHEVTNNHIHHWSRWSRIDQQAVRATGVGIRVAHNLVHDAPHNAIVYHGNDITVEYNEIYRVILEAGDAGAIYTGWSYCTRGNTVRGNYIYSLGGMGVGSCSIYLDDGMSGQTVRDNILWGGHGIWLGGGRDHIIDNNLFVDCASSIQYDSRHMADSGIFHTDMEACKRELQKMRYLEPPYITRFPELAWYKPYVESDRGVPVGNNRLTHNVCDKGPLTEWWHGPCVEADTAFVASDNYVGDPGFIARADGSYALRRDSAALAVGFKNIPESKIGLQVDEYRRTLPPRVFTFIESVTRTSPTTIVASVVCRNVGESACEGKAEVQVHARGAFRPGEFQILSFSLKPGERTVRTVLLHAPLARLTLDVVPLTDGVRPARLKSSPDAYLKENIPALIVRRVESAPLVGGIIDANVWENKPDVAVFYDVKMEREPFTQARAWFGYDDTCFYVTMKCDQTQIDPPWGTRDSKQIFHENSVEFYLDVSGDGKRLYQFAVNAGNIVYDALNNDASYNAALNTAVVRGTGYWAAAIAVPWKDLGVEMPVAGRKMGILLGRNYSGPDPDNRPAKQHLQFPLTSGLNNRSEMFASLLFE